MDWPVNVHEAGQVVGSRVEPRAVTDENQATIRDAAMNALAANRAFVTSAKPSTAAAQASQAYDQAKALSRQVNGVIRLLLGALDGTD